MNPRLDELLPYPFERLGALFADVAPAAGLAPIALTIGEPQHPPPACAAAALTAALASLSRYPATRGGDALRAAICAWLRQRFGLPRLDPERQVLPVAGTREALFSFAQAVVTPGPDAAIALPNPGYQIYEGAALLAGARPLHLPCTRATGYLPDLDALDARAWNRVQLLYLCSPGNPTGAVLDADYLSRALALADQYDFVIAADECYSEIYPDEAQPPPGLLQVAQALGNGDYARCVVFHSLSKRSNMPGLRSGFVAGDARLLAAYLRYRTYHGATLGGPVQAASIAAWSDEAHVIENRALYRAKFAAVLPILAPVLNVAAPDAGFYLWPAVGDDDEAFARALLARVNVRTLPGRYLGRAAAGGNPGRGHIRLSLVPPLQECVEAAERIAAAAG